MKMPPVAPATQPVMLEAEPEPLQIDLQRTAIVVIDMQNTFVSEGGLLNMVGADVSGTPKIVEVINNVNRAARARGSKIVYIVHHQSPDLRETGGPNSGYWYNAILRIYREHPEWRDKCITSGTWGAEIVKGLEIKEDDIVVVKPRYSAFYGTDLDTILKTFNIKYLAFAGVATNMCVEAAMRDASNLDYFSILISDATAPGGPPFLKDATIHNVRMCLGWVTTSENFVKALKK
jgi:ureidoacrylate peracid hydrolase